MRIPVCGAKTESWRGATAVTLLLASAALAAFADWAEAQTAEAQTQSATSRTVPASIREMDDPHTGRRWLLLRDPVHPGGPGRWAQVDMEESVPPMPEAKRVDVQRVAAAEAPPHPIIRGGDRLILEENTAFMEVRLEAIALGPAVPGGVFQARLKIGGRNVKAVALTPGHAALAPEIEVMP